MSEARRPANARGGHLCDFKPAHVAASCRNGCASATERYPRYQSRKILSDWNDPAALRHPQSSSAARARASSTCWM
jgi:hypothetical protein